MSTKQMTLLQAVTSLEQCIVAAWRMCPSHGWRGRQAEISHTDSCDNGKAGMIARKTITSNVFQASDAMFNWQLVHSFSCFHTMSAGKGSVPIEG